MSDSDPRCPECGGKIGQTATYCMHCSTDLTGERAAADADGDGTWDDAGGDAAASRSSPSESTASDDGEAASGAGRGHGASDVPWADDGSDADPDPTWGPDDEPAPGASGEGPGAAGPTSWDDSPTVGGGGEPMLDPDGIVDNSLTVLVGIAGGLVVGIVGTFALLIITGSGWAVLVGVLAWLGSTAYLVRRRTVQGAVAKSGYAVAAVLLLLPLVAFSPLADVDGGLSGRVAFFFVTLLAVAVPAGVAAGVGYLASRFVSERSEGTSA